MNKDKNKTTENVLPDSEARLKALSEASFEAIFLSEKGVCRDQNQTAQRMFGYTLAEAVGRMGTDWIVPEDREKVMSYMMAGFEDPYEVTALCKDGSTFPCEIQARTIEHQGRNIRVTALRNITKRKKAEKERLKLEAKVQHAQKLESLGVLAGGIAHDFNNLLMGILGYADLARMEIPPEAPAADYIHQIEISAKQAADLARQMLAYSGKGQFVIRRTNLQTLVEEMVHLLSVSISKKVLINYDFAKNVPPVEADVTQIRQIVMNLVVNASESMEDHNGVISVRTGTMECNRDYLLETYLDNDLPEGTYSYLEISDTGCGIDADNLAKMFEPFFSTKFTGRGLGLAAVLGIVRGHNGAIKVYSEPGKGTSIKVLLPSLQGATAAKTPPKTSPDIASLEGKSVMIVDDEETVLSVAKAMLKRLGIKVTTAEDGLQALQIFKNDPDGFDCILLDLTMPHMGGEETFREMRRIRKDICVVLSSGYNEKEIEALFAGKKLSGFIQKPYLTTTIGKALFMALEQNNQEE